MDKNKQYIFAYPFDLGHYSADVFAVRCFDNRFWKTFKRFIKHLNLRHIDTESIAGGAKIFSSPEKESDRDFILRELEKSIQMHHTTRVILFTHEDCGAYGGSSRFGENQEKEFFFHQSEHEKAKKIIKQHFPDLPVETYFMDFQGVIKTS